MKKIISLIILILLIAGFSFLVFRQSRFNGIESNKLQVTTSFYPMYFFTKSIGGDKVNVTNITPNGVEPHDYDPTPQDIIKIQQSKLLILNGNIEPWANKIKDDLKNKNTVILTAGDNLGSPSNPHIWLSTKFAKIESEKIKEALVNTDPINTPFYQNNLTNLENELDQINENYKTGLANCESRSFVTSHAAFNYLAKDYGLTQIAIDGLSPDAEPSLSQLAQISDLAKKDNIKVIFFESLVSPKLSVTIANEIGAKTMVLDPIEGLASDASTTTDYLTLMRSNLQNLRIALSCK